MRAITGAVVSSEPCTLREAHDMLSSFCRHPDSYLASSDCATYALALDGALREHHKFLRCLGRHEQRREDSGRDARGSEGLVQGREEDGDTEAPLGGPRGSVKEAEVAAAASEKKVKKEPRDNKAVAVVASNVLAPASPEIASEQRKKKKKNKKKKKQKGLISIVRQESDLVTEEDLGSGRKNKKKEIPSDKELVSTVKQEPGLVVEEKPGSEKKKGKNKKERDHVKLEEGIVEVKAQIVSNGVADQGVANGEKKRKKKKHSEQGGDSKGAKEEKMATDSDLNNEKKKKKKKRDRVDDGDDVLEQGEHKKKKQRKE